MNEVDFLFIYLFILISGLGHRADGSVTSEGR